MEKMIDLLQRIHGSPLAYSSSSNSSSSSEPEPEPEPEPEMEIEIESEKNTKVQDADIVKLADYCAHCGCHMKPTFGLTSGPVITPDTRIFVSQLNSSLSPCRYVYLKPCRRKNCVNEENKNLLMVLCDDCATEHIFRRCLALHPADK